MIGHIIVTCVVCSLSLGVLARERRPIAVTLAIAQTVGNSDAR